MYLVMISVVVLRGLEAKFATSKKVRELKLVVEETQGSLQDMSEMLDKEHIEVRKVGFTGKMMTGPFYLSEISHSCRSEKRFNGRGRVGFIKITALRKFSMIA